MKQHRTRRLIFVGVLIAMHRIFSADAHSTEIVLAAKGECRATIIATSDAGAATERLTTLFRDDTKTTPTLLKAPEVDSSKKLKIVLCTYASREEVKTLLPERMRDSSFKLGAEGFALCAESSDGGSIVLMGTERAGLRYAVGEFWNFHVRLNGGKASLKGPLWLTDAPAFNKRILWNWAFMTNWDDDLRRIHNTRYVDINGKLEPYMEQPDGYVRQFRRVTDYAADHRLNGLIIWGFLNDQHGGIAAGQEVSRYAKANSVRVLPGIGTVIYGGYYNGGNSDYSLVNWMSKHPEVRLMVGKDGKPVQGVPCPSDPALAKWLVDGAGWFFNEFKDIGGVNIEHGDFFECACDRCKAERARPENDKNFLWDMMYTQVPLMKAGHKINPDLWFTFSPYWGYRKEMMADPPKFLTQYPDPAIVQWTYTGMAENIEKNWPPDLKPPRGTRHSIGLLHQGSYWYPPAQWWGSGGQTYALVAETIQRTCARAIQDGSEGLEIVGQVGPASPQNELNYLAFEEFTWHPERKLDQWIEERLPAIYGGPRLAKRFYALTSDTTTDTAALEAQFNRATRIAANLKDPRQARRWQNLVRELKRRQALARAGQIKGWGPGPIPGLENVKIEF